MRIGVIGAGSWGTALGKLLGDEGNRVDLWCYEAHVVETINTEHINQTYLPGFNLAPEIRATQDIVECVTDKEMVVSVVPSHVLRSVMKDVADHIPVGVPIVSATKGIENETLMMVSEILEDVLPIHCHPYLTYLSGPSFAKEVADQKPTAVTVASYNHRLAEMVQQVFSTSRFRVYTSHDVVGVEIGGAVKNVIAIASGAASSMGFGYNGSAAIITRGLAEVTRLAVRLGGNPLTLQGLSGMGDLVLTCTGGLSRNRTLGYKLGEGILIEDILSETSMIAEGVKTSKSLYDLADRLGVDMPISEQVYCVVHQRKDPRQAVEDLLSRTLKREMVGYY
jgi:glycerol-3-phosphate dehydrogenase (NAD(P)+)